MIRKTLISAVLITGIGATATLASEPYKDIQLVEFIGMKAPQTPGERSKAYTDARVKVTYRDGTEKTFGLTYNVLHYNTTSIDGVTAGMLYEKDGTPLLDHDGRARISEAPDANTLIDIPPRGEKSKEVKGGGLYLVTHFEYDWLGTDHDIKLPMTMSLATIEQDRNTGLLKTVSLSNIDMSSVGGLWNPCAGSPSLWGTHLGSEEYEPDACCYAERCKSVSACKGDELKHMHLYLDPSGKTKPARPYNYGLVPEVTVDASGKAEVVKHRALGRISREVAVVMPDNRTVYQGDDGTYNVLTMFVADRPNDLSSGTLYAARWNQTSGDKGGKAVLTWHRLGHASDEELDALVNARKLTFEGIFESSRTPAPGFTTIKAGHAKPAVEQHLKLKEGMEQAAAFLETRRYAAYVGATTEFEKFEGVAVNRADGKAYLAISSIRNGMEDKADDPANDIRLPRLSAGAGYEMSLSDGQTDKSGKAIGSEYAGTTIRPLLLGKDIEKNAFGDTAAIDKIANPDNIKYSEKMRTLFIGEDSTTGHINNFLWAYNIDTGHLARILSVPAGAEVTGLQVVEDLDGYSYIMSNYQHAGDLSKEIDPELKTKLTPVIDKSKAAIGYISGLPAFK